MTAPENRRPEVKREGGRFVKGQSGNPGGVPKELAEMQRLAREHTPAAIKRLAEVMQGNNPTAATAAAQALLDRAWGKPTQPVEGSGGLVVQIVTGVPRNPDDPISG